MTRDEFIDGYIARSGLPASCRTPTGFALRGFRRIALPCACEDSTCDGWAMIDDDPEEISRHKREQAFMADGALK